MTDALTGIDRLRLYVHDNETFSFAYEDADAALIEIDALRAEIVATREACSLVRRQDYFDVPTPVLVEAQIEFAIWRALTDAAEAISERRRPVDNVLARHRDGEAQKP